MSIEELNVYMDTFANNGWYITKEDEDKVILVKGLPNKDRFGMILNPYIRIAKADKNVSIDSTLTFEELSALSTLISNGYFGIKDYDDTKEDEESAETDQ